MQKPVKYHFQNFLEGTKIYLDFGWIRMIFLNIPQGLVSTNTKKFNKKLFYEILSVNHRLNLICKGQLTLEGTFQNTNPLYIGFCIAQLPTHFFL